LYYPNWILNSVQLYWLIAGETFESIDLLKAGSQGVVECKSYGGCASSLVLNGWKIYRGLVICGDDRDTVFKIFVDVDNHIVKGDGKC